MGKPEKRTLTDSVSEVIAEKIEAAETVNESYSESVADALRRGVGTPMANFRGQKKEIDTLKEKYGIK
ncbi:hypothetical protein [Providencia sp. PROV149]|uniref:hypothetical protein n=1 Tax=Providencia sp. PROV149 TaxID=2949859 RepID=UPI00234B9DB2|nr:hypothetical protein [Providencia sp. PROV149]